MYPKDNAIVVMVNGVEIPISNLPYQHPEGFCLFKINNSINLSSELFSLQKKKVVNTENAILTQAVWISGQIQIRQRGPGISLHAPAHGLQEVFMDLNALKVMQGIWKHLVVLCDTISNVCPGKKKKKKQKGTKPLTACFFSPSG